MQKYPRPLETLRCPRCQQMQDLATQTCLLQMQELHPCHTWSEGERQPTQLCFYEQTEDGTYICRGDWAIHLATNNAQWACNACLVSGQAIPGQPWLQTWVDHRPYLAYWDRQKICRDCHTDFIFSAREQRYWYEELKFWVQSDAIHCLSCRRARREKKALQRQLQQQLALLDETNCQQLLHVASLALQDGSWNVATRCLSLVRRWLHERSGEQEEFEQWERLRRLLAEKRIASPGENKSAM